MSEIIKISDAESEVMKVLWIHTEPMTERQILDVLSENTNWSPTTIKTLIKRLFDKGAIKREKKEVFYYWPVLKQSDFAKERTIDLLDKVFGGNVKGLVSTMLSHDILSEDDIETLNNYWQERRRKNE